MHWWVADVAAGDSQGSPVLQAADGICTRTTVAIMGLVSARRKPQKLVSAHGVGGACATASLVN